MCVVENKGSDLLNLLVKMGALVLGEEVCCFLSFFFTLFVVEPCGVQDEKKGELT